MAGVTGLEPATSGVPGQRSNQLSYTPKRDPAMPSRETRVLRAASGIVNSLKCIYVR